MARHEVQKRLSSNELRDTLLRYAGELRAAGNEPVSAEALAPLLDVCADLAGRLQSMDERLAKLEAKNSEKPNA